MTTKGKLSVLTDHRNVNTNHRFIDHLQNAGFAREKQIVFPHKTSWYMRLGRESFDGPAL